MLRLAPILVVLAALAAAADARAAAEHPVEVVLGLEAPSLAVAVASSRALTAMTKQSRLDLDSPFSRAYLRQLARGQALVKRRLAIAVPSARVHWRYQVVINALSVVLPAREVPRLASIPGVARVYPTLRYAALLDRSRDLIGVTPEFLGPGLSTAGGGVKIAVLDAGVDHRHPFLDPNGFAIPQGFPRGDGRFTTAKVIAARVFPPPGLGRVATPVEARTSEHGTHVAGIAAGNAGTVVPGVGTLSGVAPRAWIGNYRVLTLASASGPHGRSPEIARGVEAAVRDGMDVINLSLGGPEIEPGRDVVIQAVNGAARAGAVVVAAAGNDFPALGFGSVASPATATGAIAVAAVGSGKSIPPGVLARQSSSGPVGLALRLKPEVAAPGDDVVSSGRDGGWARLSGTSMAAPHVAGAAALLRQRHPGWTPAQLASALVLTGRPVPADGVGGATVAPTRAGGGLVDVRRAARPLLFAAPASVSFGFLRPGSAVTSSVSFTDAGGGNGVWTAAIVQPAPTPGVVVDAPAAVSIPGAIALAARIASGAAEQGASGWLVLTRGAERRSIPFWLRVDVPHLAAPVATLVRPGVYRGNTAGRPARAAVYRYPEIPAASPAGRHLAGPEQSFRIRLRRPSANLGVVVLGRGRGVGVEPRIVIAGNESRLAGQSALPLQLNPLLPDYGRVQRTNPASAVVRPLTRAYDVVFDSPAGRAGAFTFRLWIGDTTPPRVRLLTRSARLGRPLVLEATDTGAGVDPASIVARVDGRPVATRYLAGPRHIVVQPGRLARGSHVLRLAVSDYQEAKNAGALGPPLPNTRALRLTFTVLP